MANGHVGWKVTVQLIAAWEPEQGIEHVQTLLLLEMGQTVLGMQLKY